MNENAEVSTKDHEHQTGLLREEANLLFPWMLSMGRLLLNYNTIKNDPLFDTITGQVDLSRFIDKKSSENTYTAFNKMTKLFRTYSSNH